MSREMLPFAVIGLSSVIAWALLYGLIVRVTAPSVVHSPIRLWSAFFGALAGIATSAVAALAIGAAFARLTPIVPPMQLLGAIVPASFLSSATMNQLIVRREDGAALTFSQACRLQLIPTLLTFGIPAMMGTFGASIGRIVEWSR